MFISCDNEGMNNEDKIIEESLFAENPFLGTWKDDFKRLHVFKENLIYIYATYLYSDEYNLTPSAILKYKFDDKLLRTLGESNDGIDWTSGELDYPYNFKESNMFNFYGSTLKKISLKTEFP